MVTQLKYSIILFYFIFFIHVYMSNIIHLITSLFHFIFYLDSTGPFFGHSQYFTSLSILLDKSWGTPLLSCPSLSFLLHFIYCMLGFAPIIISTSSLWLHISLVSILYIMVIHSAYNYYVMSIHILCSLLIMTSPPFVTFLWLHPFYWHIQTN